MRHDGVSTTNPVGSTSMLDEPFNQSGVCDRANCWRNLLEEMSELSPDQKISTRTAIIESTATKRNFRARITSYSSIHGDDDLVLRTVEHTGITFFIFINHKLFTKKHNAETCTLLKLSIDNSLNDSIYRPLRLPPLD